ncbi:MAG: ABC transporter permease subunit [Ilumatobacteraceae bacterium]
MSGRVGAAGAISLTYGIVLRQLVTRGRLAALFAVGAVVTAVAYAVGATDLTDRTVTGVELISNLGFTTLLPIVALVFASAALGDLREDGTLVYLWLRPMQRWSVVVGAWAASVTASLPLTLVPLVASAIVVDGGSDLVWATLLAGLIGVITYAAIFVLVGLVLKNPIVWGLGYILIWEGIVAAFGSFAAKLAVRGYTRSIITAITGVDLELGELSLTAGVVVPLLVSVAALGLAARRLRTMEVA